MKKLFIGLAVALFVIVDLCVLLYPTVAAYFNDKSQSRVVTRELEEIAAMDDTQTRTLLAAAREYNAKLLNNPDRFRLTDKEQTEYMGLLNTGRDVMGILVIEKINVKLAIYHGTDQAVLQIGLGHMPGTSLPVGGRGTHAFITGHRGVPSSTLLTDLDKIAEGDTFVLFVMGETLTYEVDDIKIVEPHEVESLNIDLRMDYCTLVTCTPYGINSHRLLVRGRRVENIISAGWHAIYADAQRLGKPLIILLFTVPVVLPALIAYMIFRCVRIRKMSNAKIREGGISYR